ncbi:hypothetical protein G5C60_10000 [Streptomyces sp. HC44]|uniref:Adhesin domain-containing protein n=1 Tax=Streptomyces scabichelini TaxID=2711217 RepID=A0A6G4V1P5_9ACTN|nr:hypothetical protein [Streptomyces scabichelini]NGO07972.1 hypothetical protein [Streptomyces scabichelini]
MKTKAHAAAALTLMALLSGCMTDEETSETNSYTVKETVSALDVESNGGLIELVASDRTTVQVTEKFRYSGGKPKTEHAVSGSTLTLKTPGCSSDSSPCEVSYRLEVPRTLSVTLASEGGAVEVTALAGNLTVDTDGGSADAAFSAAPDTADVRTSGGDLSLRLPGGPYAVDADADGGTEKVTVKTDPASARKVTAKSGGGDITIGS